MQCCSLYDPDGGDEVDPGGRLRGARSQLVAAHLALDATRHPPATVARHALLQDLGQHRLMQGGPGPRGEAPRRPAACVGSRAPCAGTRAGPGLRPPARRPRASARAPRSGPAAAPRMHLRIAWPGVITAAVLAPANEADLAVAPQLLAGLAGWALGDKGYWSPVTRVELAADGLDLIAPPRGKNAGVKRWPVRLVQ